MNYGNICNDTEAATFTWKPSDTGFRMSREV